MKCYTPSLDDSDELNELNVDRSQVIELNDNEDSQIINNLISNLINLRNKSNISYWMRYHYFNISMYPITIFDVNHVFETEQDIIKSIKRFQINIS